MTPFNSLILGNTATFSHTDFGQFSDKTRVAPTISGGCRWMHSWCVSVHPNVIFSFPRHGLSFFFFFAHLNISAPAGDNATVSKMSALKCNISYTETCEAAWIYSFGPNSYQKWCLHQLAQPSQSWISLPIPMFSKSPASLLTHPPFPACSAPCELCTNID